ncbi:MAG TPA: hypothetical protein VGN17_21215 [Bryobacteraceae bacterium]|jgi:hypothetical protein
MTLLSTAAGNVQTDEETLQAFHQAGWIKFASKNGNTFVSGQDEYRSRFILHLRQKMNLTDQQIGIVLENGKPPYSLEQVPTILASYSAD